MSKMILNKDTLVPLGLVASVIGLIAGGILWATSMSYGQKETNDQLKWLSNEFAALREDFERTSANQWTRRDQIMWAELLKAQNPNMSVPMPHD